jgi:hypothetical protein
VIDLLIARLRRDQFNEDEGSELEQIKRKSHNQAMWHVEHVIVPEVLQEAERREAHRKKIEAGLAELRDAKALDLRLRNQLCEMQEGML